MLRALISLALAAPAFAQNQTDAQLTQTLITEIRALRQDLQTTAATIQRIQIALYRSQAQSAVLTHATQRLDDAHNQCAALQTQRKMVTTELEQAQERIRSTQDLTAQSLHGEYIQQHKNQLDRINTQEQQCQVRESEADSQFRAERAKMTDLEDQLEKLDKVLAGVGR
jgi:valyl-tRNA synthetase